MTSRRRLFDEDVAAFVNPRAAPKGIRLLAKVVSEPGLQFVWIARLQMSLEQNGRSRLARLIHLVNLRWTGAEFGHGCQVGGGFVAKHPLGVVVGSGTVIGRNCTVLHNVVFGERRVGYSEVEPKYPTLGDDCLVGTGAVVLGAVVVGSSSKIGAGAIVLHDVPDGATVVGNPARQL